MTKPALRYLIRKDHLITTLLAGALVLLLSLITFTIPAFNPIAKGLRNLSVTDWFFQLENKYIPADTCDQIVIVDMTELHSRADIGNLLIELSDLTPRCIGVDLIFEGVKDDLEGNFVLEQAIEEVASISVFTNKLTNYDKENNTFTGLVFSYFRDQYSITEGYANVVDNMEGTTIRELTVTQNSVLGKQKSFVAQIAEKEGKTATGNGNIIINYKPTHIPVVPFDSLQQNKNLIKDKIVLIGTLTEEQDMHLTPLGKMAGIEIQAYSLLTVLDHSDIYFLSLTDSVVIGLLLCYLYAICFDLTARFVNSRRAKLRIFLTESRIHLTLLSIMYVSAVSFFAFLIFERCNIYINMVIVLAMIAFVGLGRRLYFATTKTINYEQS